MKNVLFIDDDPSVTNVAKEIFIHSNMNCIMCDSYDCAIFAIDHSKNIDIIIVDVVLKGDKTGIDIVEYLNKNNIRVPVIITTGYGDVYKSDIIRLKADVLHKPYDACELIDKINKKISSF
jgi:DNA-binding NtrC family response regulator